MRYLPIPQTIMTLLSHCRLITAGHQNPLTTLLMLLAAVSSFLPSSLSTRITWASLAFPPSPLSWHICAFSCYPWTIFSGLYVPSFFVPLSIVRETYVS